MISLIFACIPITQHTHNIVIHFGFFFGLIYVIVTDKLNRFYYSNLLSRKTVDDKRCHCTNMLNSSSIVVVVVATLVVD